MRGIKLKTGLGRVVRLRRGEPSVWPFPGSGRSGQCAVLGARVGTRWGVDGQMPGWTSG